jgi:cytochrome c oxidase subunit II
MRSKVMRYWCVLMVLLCSLSAETKMVEGTAAQRFSTGGSQKSPNEDVQVIEMTARKYEFSPSALHVKAGTKVLLKITAIDREHGFKITANPEGAELSVDPGLEFVSPQPRNGWRLNNGEETTVEFVAKRAGTYEFKCSVVCGFGHGRMQGKLVVDP